MGAVVVFGWVVGLGDAAADATGFASELLFGAGVGTFADGAWGGGATDAGAVVAPCPWAALFAPSGSRSTTNAPMPPIANMTTPTIVAGTASERLGMSAPVTDTASAVVRCCAFWFGEEP